MSRTPVLRQISQHLVESSAASTTSIMGIDDIAPVHPQEIVERTALLDEERGNDLYGTVTPPIAGE